MDVIVHTVTKIPQCTVDHLSLNESSIGKLLKARSLPTLLN